MDKRILKILLIEDNPGDADLVRFLIKELDDSSRNNNFSEVFFQMTVAESLASGFQELQKNSFDVILLDLNLPDSSGLDTVKRTIAAYPNIPIIVLSGLSDKDTAINAVQMGTQDYLVKGRIDANLLERAIRYAMERKEVQQRLLELRNIEDQNRFKTQLLENMSHELRTPLNAIVGYCQLMQLEVGPSLTAEQKEYLSQINKSSEHLVKLIDEVLEVSRLISSPWQFHCEKINVQSFLDEWLKTFTQLLSQKKINFKSEIDRNVNDLYLDPLRLQDVLSHYMSNAIKFTPENGAITLRMINESADKFRIEVEDNGIGIKEEDLKKLFLVFQQLDEGNAKRYPGLGLGLVLVKNIVEALGGQVGVQSTFGKGSVFYAILPKQFQSI